VADHDDPYGERSQGLDVTAERLRGRPRHWSDDSG
jgi:hypothetical protein